MPSSCRCLGDGCMGSDAPARQFRAPVPILRAELEKLGPATRTSGLERVFLSVPRADVALASSTAGSRPCTTTRCTDTSGATPPALRERLSSCSHCPTTPADPGRPYVGRWTRCSSVRARVKVVRGLALGTHLASEILDRRLPSHASLGAQASPHREAPRTPSTIVAFVLPMADPEGRPCIADPPPQDDPTCRDKTVGTGSRPASKRCHRGWRAPRRMTEGMSPLPPSAHGLRVAPRAC